MCLQCCSTSPLVRTQPFYLTDLSNYTKTKDGYLYIYIYTHTHPGAPSSVLGSGTVLGSWFQFRPWLSVPVSFLVLVPFFATDSGTILFPSVLT